MKAKDLQVGDVLIVDKVSDIITERHGDIYGDYVTFGFDDGTTHVFDIDATAKETIRVIRNGAQIWPEELK